MHIHIATDLLSPLQLIIESELSQTTRISMDSENKKVDIYRDTPVRYLGYANEVGEAFRSIVPKSVVLCSYIIACGYVLADTLQKASLVYKTDSSPDRDKKVLLSTSDTLLWQGFASVIIPGITINRICAGVLFLQKKSRIKSSFKSPWISTVIGFASIPLIIRPIDIAVEETMNSTFRKWTGYNIKHDKERAI